MDRGHPFVTVVVVNYNGRHFLADCLGALERQTLPRHRYEIVLIDNSSADGSAGYVRAHFPGVRVVEPGRNLGFTGANNLGFRRARGRYVVLLNNDTRPEPGWLAALVAVADGDRVGGVTSRVLFRDEPGLVNSTGLELYRDGRGGDRHLRRPDGPDTRRPGEVFGGCGASLLLTRELLDDIGGFDPALFMYYEDLDLCLRARLRGYEVLYVPEAIVKHSMKVSGRPVLYNEYLDHRNRLRTTLKVWSARRLARVLPRAIAFDVMSIGGLVMGGRFRAAGLRLRAWAWNVGHLLSTLRRRSLIQRRRRVADRVLE